MMDPGTTELVCKDCGKAFVVIAPSREVEEYPICRSCLDEANRDLFEAPEENVKQEPKKPATPEPPPADPTDPGPQAPVPTPAPPAAAAPPQTALAGAIRSTVEAVPVSAVTTREHFDGTTRELSVGETAGEVLAAQGKAQVEARYIMAMRNPRDVDAFRVNLLKDCNRVGFADVAEYAKPIGGGKVKGPSIRFVESALRHFRNVLIETLAVFDDERKKIVRVTLTDLEANIDYAMDVTIEKTVERSQPKLDGDGNKVFLATRKNTGGGTVYIVPATEDDLLNKERAMISKTIRLLGIRVLPGDIVDEALKQCRDTKLDRAKKDPDTERRAIADGFAALNVPIEELKSYIGHELSTCSPAELVDLRALWNAIRDGEQSWSDAREKKKFEKPIEQPKRASDVAAPPAEVAK